MAERAKMRPARWSGSKFSKGITASFNFCDQTASDFLKSSIIETSSGRHRSVRQGSKRSTWWSGCRQRICAKATARQHQRTKWQIPVFKYFLGSAILFEFAVRHLGRLENKGKLIAGQTCDKFEPNPNISL